jgi:hypothetical protein
MKSMATESSGHRGNELDRDGVWVAVACDEMPNRSLSRTRKQGEWC